MVMKFSVLSVHSACLTIDVCCQSWIADCNKTKQQQQDLELHFLKGSQRASKQLHFGLEVLKVTNPHLEIAAALRLETLLQQRYVLALSWLRLNMFCNSTYVCAGNGDR